MMASLAPRLPPSSSVVIALSAASRQGEYGAVTALAREHGVTRHAVYYLRERATAALEREFTVDEAPLAGGITITVTEADIARTVIALRVMTPSSIRDEVAMLPVIYGTGWSFGKIQGLLVEAGERAARQGAGVDLSGIQHVAQDEMFSQGQAVLAGIDLDTQYLYLLEAHEPVVFTPGGRHPSRLAEKVGTDYLFVEKQTSTERTGWVKPRIACFGLSSTVQCRSRKPQRA